MGDPLTIGLLVGGGLAYLAGVGATARRVQGRSQEVGDKAVILGLIWPILLVLFMPARIGYLFQDARLSRARLPQATAKELDPFKE